MAIENKKISQLDINGNPSGSNLIPMEADGVTMAIPLSGISSFILPNGNTDVFVTGGTYSNGVTTFTNNTGGTFTVNGYFTGATDVFVTGGTYTAGTATFTNNTGGTFNVSGFLTGSTDITITGATFTTNNLLTLRNTTGGTVTTTLNNFTGIKITGQTTIGDGFPAGITQYGRTATVANNQYSYGIQEYSFVTANNGFRGYLGVQSWPYITGGVPGTMFGKFAGYVTAFSSAPIWDGSIGGSNQLPNMMSLFSALQAQAGGILNTYDIYASEINTVGGTTQNPVVVNHYALYSEPFTYATNNYGIYINGPQSNYFGGRVGIGIPSSQARLHITAGTASIPQILLNNGVVTSAATNGAIEFDGIHFYGTVGSKRYTLENQINVSASSMNYLITTADTNSHFTNEGAITGITFTLPSAAKNMNYSFFLQNSNQMTIQAATSNTIRIATNVTSSGGAISSTTIGSSITLVAINSNEWLSLNQPAGSWLI